MYYVSGVITENIFNGHFLCPTGTNQTNKLICPYDLQKANSERNPPNVFRRNFQNSPKTWSLSNTSCLYWHSGAERGVILACDEVTVLGPEPVWQAPVCQTQEGLLPRQVLQLLGDDVYGVLIPSLSWHTSVLELSNLYISIYNYKNDC